MTPSKKDRKFRLRRWPPAQLVIYFLLRSLIAVIEMLDPRDIRKIGRFLGRIGYLLDAKHRPIAVKNVTRASGMPKEPREVARFVRRVYEQMGIGFVETLMIPRLMAQRDLSSFVSIGGRDGVDEALTHGRGAIVVIAHLGNWEIGGLACARDGMPISSIARPIDNPYLDEWLNRLRKSTGAGIIPKHGATPTAREILKANRVLVILADQDARKSGIFVPFFGRPASTVRSPAILALRHRVPIFPANVYREGRDRHVVRIMEPIWPGEYASVDEGVRELTAAFTARLEGYIREHPDQWMWLHARWKTKPADAPSDEMEVVGESEASEAGESEQSPAVI
jgi:KDO2-lipid IV(A) lauroyltransferase